MFKEYQSIIVNKSDKIVDVMKKINIVGSRIALIVDTNDKFIGIATDGDIRRSLINGISPEEKISKAMNKEPKIANDKMEHIEMLQMLNDRHKEIPIINSEKRVVGLLNIEDKDLMGEVKSRKVCILGLGYVGLPLSLVLAEKGFEVVGYDIDSSRLKEIEKGNSPIHEPGIDSYMKRFLGKNFNLSNELNKSVSDIYVITVGTPVDEKTKIPITEFIDAAARSLSKVVKKNDLIILRSTVTVGTSRNVFIKSLMKESGLQAGRDFFLSYAPERTIEGNAIKEIQELPQIIGGYDKISAHLTDQFFRELTSTIVDVGSLEGAEMVKILNNTFRDTKFAYANEMALICKELGLDAVKLFQAANMDYARGQIPLPSPGVGGACLTKDPYILIESCNKIDFKPNLVKLARSINEKIPNEIVNDILKELSQLNKNLKKVKIFIMGFAFKGSPETADIRGSTTKDLIDLLLKNGANSDNLFGYDYIVEQEEIENFQVNSCDLKNGFKNADVIIIMNNHKSYKTLDIFSLLETSNEDCIFVDGWYTFDPIDIISINNINYLGVGCKKSI